MVLAKDKLDLASELHNLSDSSTIPPSLKVASFGILNQTTFNKYAAYTILSFHALQTLCLLIESSFYSFPNSESSIEVFTSIIRDLILARDLVEIEDFQVFQVSVLVTIAVYLTCILGIGAFFLRSYLGNKDMPALITRNWKNLGHIHFYLLFMPIHNILFELITQTATRNVSPDMAWPLFSFAILGEFINIGFSLTQLAISLNIKTFDHIATQDTNFLKFCLFIRVYISIINLLIQDQHVFYIPPIVLNVINLLLVVCYSAVFNYTYPFFHKGALAILSLENSAAFCIGLVNIILTLMRYADTGINVGYAIVVSLLIVPVCIKFIVNFMGSRASNTVLDVSSFIFEDASTLRLNRYWFVQSIYNLKQTLESKIQANFLSNRYPKKMTSQIGHVKFFYELLFDRDIDTKDIYNMKEDLRVLIIQFMESWLKKRPKDHLVRVVLADLMCNDFNRIYEPYALVEHVLRTSNRTSLKLSALKIKENIQRTIVQGNLEKSEELDLSFFFEGSQVYDRLREKIEAQLAETETFFKIIQEKSPNLNNMGMSSIMIQKRKDDVNEFWAKIPSEFTETYLPLCLAYGIYKSGMNYEYKEGNEVLHRYYNLIRRRQQLKNNSEINEETLFSSNNIAILINTDKTEFGMIKHCTKNVKKMFNTTDSSLIGKNLKDIMSPFFQNIHDRFIKKKLESTETIRQSKYLSTFAMDKDGFVFPVNLLVTLFPWINSGIYFSGIIRPIRTWLDYILVDEFGFIDSSSKSLQSKLNLPSALKGAKININRICKSFGTMNTVLNSVQLTLYNKKESSSVLDLYSLNIWKRDSFNHMKTVSQIKVPETRLRRGAIEINSPISPLALQCPSPLTPKRKSRFSLSPSHNNLPYSREIESEALEIVSTGKTLKFDAYVEDPSKELLKNKKSIKVQPATAGENPGSGQSKSTVMSAASDGTNSSLRSSKMYHCRVEVKKYDNRVLKVLIMNEISGENFDAKGRKGTTDKPKTPSPQKNFPLLVTKRTTVEYLAEKAKTAKFNNNDSSDFSAPLRSHSDDDSQDYIPRENEGASTPVTIPNFVDGSALKKKRVVLLTKFSSENVTDRNKTSSRPSDNDSRTSSDSDSDEESKSTSNHLSSPDQKYKLDIFKRQNIAGSIGSQDKSAGRKRSPFHYDSMTQRSNEAGALNSYTEGESTSRIMFEMDRPVTSFDGDISSLDRADPQSSTRIGLKPLAKIKSFSFTEHIPTMKFYQFSRAKIPFMWLCLGLLMFLVSSIVMFSIATVTIPVIEDSISFARSSIDRIFSLVLIVRYSATLSVFTSNPSPARIAMIPVHQNSMKRYIAEFSRTNQDLTGKINIFSQELQSYFFHKNIKVYTNHFEDRGNLTDNYLYTDSFKAPALIVTHAEVVANAQNVTGEDIKYSVSFILENVYNDILVDLRRIPTLIFSSISDEMDQTRNNQKLLIIVTSALFFLALLILLKIYIGSYMDVRKFMQYFIHYPAKDIHPLLTNINLFRNILNSHMQDEKLLHEFKGKDHFAIKYNGALEKTKVVNERKFALVFIQTMIAVTICFTFPITTLVISRSLFEESLSGIQSMLDGTVQIKRLNQVAMLSLSQAVIYNVLPQIYCNNIKVGDSVAKEMETLSNIVLEINSDFQPELYPLLYQDFCVYINPSNMTNCREVYNGAAKSGIIGATLAVQGFLQTYKAKIDAGNITEALALGDIYMLDTYNLMGIYVKDAITYFEDKRAASMTENLSVVKTRTILFIGFGLLVAIATLISTVGFIYIPSKKARKCLSNIISLFPFRMITMNKFLTSFLQRDSKVLNELLKRRQF